MSEEPGNPRVSIVMPTLNESTRIRNAVRCGLALRPFELIVVDGGSDDNTVEKAREAGASLVVEHVRGRGPQQNRGAELAHGNYLLFLHADCKLEASAINTIHEAMQDPRTVGGCFRQRIDADGPIWRILERGNDLRARLGLAYGDQAIFVRRQLFEQIGGFPDEPFMEELVLVRRLRRRGRFCLLSPRVQVSPRRWQQRGVIRQTLRNWMLLLLFRLGFSPRSLIRFYPHVR